ncbi:MAG: protein-export chaperone SecB [Alphaproteobacteria bacterium]|nr:protein-export chaperone SecB [Alphaproteobacteria bacterium]
MSDTPAPPGAVVLLHHYVRDMSFEHPDAPYSFKDAHEAKPLVDVQVTYRQLDAHTFETQLTITASAKREDMVVAVIELSYAGTYRLPAIPHELREVFLMVEAPRELFPFARALIGLVTMQAGIPPLLIVAPNFQDTYRRMNEDRLKSEGAI